MSLTAQLKANILKIIKRPIPTEMNIVSQSVPIPFFGDIETAHFATISLNPSYNEFLLGKNKDLLPEGKKRLIDRESLNRGDLDVLTDDDAAMVFDSLRTYFSHKPYNSWFSWLETNAGLIFNSSYYDGTMVNLDIYPWATKDTWSDLDEPIRNNALKSYNLLADLLLSKPKLFDCIYINGTTVKLQLESVCGITIQESKVKGWLIYHCQLPNGTIMIGSNHYIKESHLSREKMQDLRNVIKNVLETVYGKKF